MKTNKKVNKGKGDIKMPEINSHICESDGLVYTSYPPQYKCKICGRFSYCYKGDIELRVPNYWK